MTEVFFYHLKGQTPEQVLPTLLQKSLDRGWRVVVQASSEERVEARVVRCTEKWVTHRSEVGQKFSHELQRRET